MKQKESMNCLRMAHKLDCVNTIIRSNQTSQTVYKQFYLKIYNFKFR